MNPPREEQSAGQESVHAEATGGDAPPIRTTSGVPADRAKLRDRGEHGVQVPAASRGGRCAVAAAGGLGRGPAGSGAVSKTGSAGQAAEYTARAARLRRDARAVAATPPSDAAAAVGGIPAGESGRLSLLALLRVVSALALET